jgi:hypothetical protein
MIAESVDGDAPNFHVLATSVVSADERLHFVAHSFFERALTGDCCLARSFTAATGLEDLTRTSTVKTSQLSSALTFG